MDSIIFGKFDFLKRVLIWLTTPKYYGSSNRCREKLCARLASIASKILAHKCPFPCKIMIFANDATATCKSCKILAQKISLAGHFSLAAPDCFVTIYVLIHFAHARVFRALICRHSWSDSNRIGTIQF